MNGAKFPESYSVTLPAGVNIERQTVHGISITMIPASVDSCSIRGINHNSMHFQLRSQGLDHGNTRIDSSAT